MHLITMAHLGEALSVIEKFRLVKKTPDLYVGEDLLLLITGEGPFEAAVKTALILPQYPIKEIINLGIAGTLDPELEVGQILAVRTIYLIQDLKPAFKTFGAFEAGHDCLTSFERILDPVKAVKLKGIGSLVDREAWGVAMVAKSHGTEFKAFKIISDLAGTILSCELVKTKAPEFSLALANHLENYLKRPKNGLPNFQLLAGFHFTFSTEHKFRNFLSKLSIKENVTEEFIHSTLPYKELLDKKILPKERARLLLEEMENRIDPTRVILNQKKSQWLEAFEQKGIKVHTDPQWEDPKVIISFEISSDEELSAKASSLHSLTIRPFLDLMKGHFHVE